MHSQEQPQERLLVTCSPFLRNVTLDTIVSALKSQLLLDPKDGKWYQVGDTRIEHHKIYGTIYEDPQMNSLDQQQ